MLISDIIDLDARAIKRITKWVWFAERCGVANKEMLNVIERIGNINDIYLADYESYIENGISKKLAQSLSDKSLDGAHKIIARCAEGNVGILCYTDDDYPKSLRTLKDPPAVLYYSGRLPKLNSKLCIAMVGTRKMSEYGMKAAYKIAYETASAGAVTVSGMALGIDAVVAGATIAACGETVAVLGCGIDVIYPKQHTKLCESIKEHGAIITEYPPYTNPRSFNFPVRNRIISGLSQGTAVIDADLQSGSMITARSAILQGRDVFAVPCNIDSEKLGTNALIRDGAQAIVSGYDIVKNYTYTYKNVLNLDRLKESESRSDFNREVFEFLSVKVGGEKPANEGGSARAEKQMAVRQVGNTAAHGNAASAKAQSAAKKSISNAHAYETAQDTVGSSGTAREGDESRKALESINERFRRVFDEMPLDKAVSIDDLIKVGFKPVEVIAALTFLEIKGLVSSLPGALYIRK